MSDIYFTNTLSKKKELFKPTKEGQVGIYSCGPTVYWDQHIGHMYAYVQWDTLVRFLRLMNYKVTWVMNITDVGHMTSDEDTGEDKMEKGAKREGISVWDLADKYIEQFEDSMKLLNITTPDKLPRVTENIDDQIELIKIIKENGFTYQTNMGVVYDTSKFPDYAKFANLNLEKQQQIKDLEVDDEKKEPWDFLLWITGNKKHIMKWKSPWGEGYPGWHIECTAMSTKYLGESFDIHTGGREHIGIHHTNEIAQGHAAFGKHTANIWLHNAWLTGKKGEKMSKSLGNYVTAQSLVEKGYDPIALRYLILNSHYSKGLKFSFEALDSAQNALKNIYQLLSGYRNDKRRTTISSEKEKKVDGFRNKFTSALSDDLNTPQALAVFWEMMKSNIPSEDKYDLALMFDEVLGLRMKENSTKVEINIPKEITALLDKREEFRKSKDFKKADEVRDQIEKEGYTLLDLDGGTKVTKS